MSKGQAEIEAKSSGQRSGKAIGPNSREVLLGSLNVDGIFCITLCPRYLDGGLSHLQSSIIHDRQRSSFPLETITSMMDLLTLSTRPAHL